MRPAAAALLGLNAAGVQPLLLPIPCIRADLRIIAAQHVLLWKPVTLLLVPPPAYAAACWRMGLLPLRPAPLPLLTPRCTLLLPNPGAYIPVFLAKRDRLAGGSGRSMAYVLGNMLRCAAA